MAIYNPPIKNLPIFDSSVFLTGDVFITQNQADKRYLRYQFAQGTENLQAIIVNGTALMNEKTTMTNDTIDTLLEIIKTSGYSNDGVLISNLGINQSQSTNTNFSNNLGQINLLPNKSLTVNAGTLALYSGNQGGNYLIQYVNGTSYIWSTNIGGTVFNILDLNETTGLNFYQLTNFYEPVTISSSTFQTLLELTYTGGYTNDGLVLTNVGINQSQSNSGFVNTLGQINMIGGKDINLDGGKLYLYEAYPSGNYINQYINGSDYIWTTNITGTIITVLNLNQTTGLNINTKTNFTAPITMTSTDSGLRIINNTYYNMIDANSNLNNGTINSTLGNFIYDNNANSGSHTFYNNNSSSAQINTLLLNTTNLTINTTSLPTAPLATIPAFTDNSSIIPTTQWVQGAISAATTPLTVTLTSYSKLYNAIENYSQFFFTGFPNWAAYNWIFSTSLSGRTTQTYLQLGNTPCPIPNVTSNSSYVLMTGIGITQTYSGTSSVMTTNCSGTPQDYTVTATSTAAILSIISCIGSTPEPPIYVSNDLTENTNTCPPTGNPLSGYIMLQMSGPIAYLNNQPTLKLIQLIA